MPPIAVPLDQPLPVDIVGAELKRGAVHNTIAMLASNFIGFFPLLIAWLLGPTVLGIFAYSLGTPESCSLAADERKSPEEQ